MTPREILLNSFEAALAAADPLKVVPRHLPAPPRGRTLVIGAGKAAAAMAAAVESVWPAQAALAGIVITRYGHGMPTQRIEVVEGGHPVPDTAGENASRRILEQVAKLGPDDLLLALISGGGSSLLSLPVPPISMDDLKAVTRDLLKCGATIQEINTVRKHVSAIQGGRLAAACQAPILALVISDVTGDDPTHVASGPCAPDPSKYEDALAILERYAITPPPALGSHLERGARGEIEETPKPSDTRFGRVENRVIATSHDALAAASAHFEKLGIFSRILGDSVTGEAREVAKVYGPLAREIKKHSEPWPTPVALISGGETTVTVRGKGRGGRNCEFLLSLAIDLDGLAGVYALACDTDGIDGSENNAGAVLMPDALMRAQAAGLRADRMLADNDGYTFFDKIGDLVVTGPTRTNVNDLRVILVM
jgi:hydroxypyruvate reductase